MLLSVFVISYMLPQTGCGLSEGLVHNCKTMMKMYLLKCRLKMFVFLSLHEDIETRINTRKVNWIDKPNMCSVVVGQYSRGNLRCPKHLIDKSC